MNKKVNNFLSQYIKIQGLFQGPTKIKDFVKDLQNSRIFQGLFKDLQISRTFQGPYAPCVCVCGCDVCVKVFVCDIARLGLNAWMRERGSGKVSMRVNWR